MRILNLPSFFPIWRTSKYIILLGGILNLFPLNLEAQITAERQVISSMGNEARSSNGVYTLSQTLSEIFTATLKNGPLVATQGFEQWQGDDIPLNIDLVELGILQLEMFPNPASTELNLSSLIQNPIKLNFRLYDLHGRSLLELKNVFPVIGRNFRKLNLEEFPEGHYFLVFQMESGIILYKQILQVVN